MVDETSNLVLEHLRHIRAVVDETNEDVKRLMLRTGVIQQHFASFRVSEAGQNLEIDRIKSRLDRIERRLELTDR
jgi:archaellum component FlaC